MKYLRPTLTASIVTLLTFLMPLQVLAASTVASPILITEMSPGTSASASQEFIELYNQSSQAINLSADGWQVQITSSKATTWDKAKVVSLSGVFYPGTYLIISSNYTASGDVKSYLQDNATAQFSAGLTASSGHIRVTYMPSSVVQVADRLEWSTEDANNSLTSAPITSGDSYVALDSPIGAGLSLKRKISDSIFTTTNLEDDFLVSTCPTPTATNTHEYASQETDEPLATTIDTTNQSCAPIDDPQESGSGVTAPTDEPPATLLPAESEATESSSSAALPRMPAADIGLSSPSITELLPNPGSPQTDSQDEFIEFYNGNDATFDLSGFQLYIGLTGSKHYTFPEGTTIPPRTFKAFFSADTKISLSNSGGRVVLYDPLGKLLVQTDEYGTAKDSQAWALASGKWQWTTKPTPNAANTILVPATAKKKATAKTASKASAPKAANGSARTAATVNDAQAASNLEEKRSLHPLALAVVGGFALLYGAYEYRHDVANKFHQLRSYRAARRKTRQELKGR